MDESTEKTEIEPAWKKKAKFTLFQSPAVIFAGLFWERVLENPITAFLSLAVYEIGVFFLLFGKKIYLKIWKAEPITETGLEGKVINACVDWLENKLPERVSNLRRSINFKKAYEKAVYYEHRFFNVKGLRTQGNFTLELDKVFVELKISPTINYQQGRLNLLDIKELEGSRSIWDFLSIAKQQQPEFAPAFAIIGAPGSGKTTLLQYIALSLIKDKKLIKSNGYVPILLFLREHTKNIIEKEPPTLSQLVQIHFSQHKRYQNLQPPTNYFEEQLKAGKCLIMLDGLDEVANENQRKKVSSWVNEQIKTYRQCPFILTSRPQGYKTAPLENVNVLEIQPFNYQQIKKFIHNWYLANEIMSTAKEDEGVKHNAQLNADDLLERLQSLPSLSALTVNPLLLTMIAMVHRYRGQLPGRRVELYAEICDVLLGHWRAAKGIKENLTAAQKRVILQPLAAEMMLRGKRQISNQEALEIIAEPLKTVNLNKTETINFLPNVQASSGLLQESEIGEWQFAHLSFQEYLAATHFIEHKELLDFSTIIETTWWHETLRLYAAQTDATDLVKNCLKKQSIAAFSLAADCLEEARQIQTEVREEVEKKLISDLESDDPEKRKFAAEIQLFRRLNKQAENNTPIKETTGFNVPIVEIRFGQSEK
jgi:predicted NACHT family NTPase